MVRSGNVSLDGSICGSRYGPKWNFLTSCLTVNESILLTPSQLQPSTDRQKLAGVHSFCLTPRVPLRSPP